jgi:hypothetical protein
VSLSPEELQEIERKKTGYLSAAIWKTGLQITANRTPHEVSLNSGELFYLPERDILGGVRYLHKDT